jgi:hypothetical protein
MPASGATRMAKCKRGRASLEEKVYRPRKSITQVIHSARIHSARIILLVGLDPPFGGWLSEPSVKHYRSFLQTLYALVDTSR